jgi:L-threonylcarbamoyladenylate synthase
MTSSLQTRIVAAGRDAIAQAAGILARGGLVAFPTETVYGLGADATQGEAVARLYAAKGRPSFNPLIAHVASHDAARANGAFNAAADRLARAFWPGPLTLVLPKSRSCAVSALATAGLETIALRVPDHPVAQALLTAYVNPVVAPSANRSGHVSPTTAQHVMDDLAGRIDLVIDGGVTRVGLESTIVACVDEEPRLLRYGAIARADIERILERPLYADTTSAEGEAAQAPGMLASHYAPKARLRLNATSAEPGEALLAFGPEPPAGAGRPLTLNLSASGDLIEAAANLFAHLRALDGHADKIAVMPIPNEGLGEAINDRLARAAAAR